ncbi:MAG: sugar phosphate isomerase/epimerase [Clostridia bacterium]|nr:sugar phosphate isomerase/epimerase [Clostridia bacterium]
MKLKKYMSSCHLFSKDNWLECIRWAKDHGFEGVELFGGEGNCAFENMHISRLDEIADCARQNGIELSLHPWIDWTNLSEADLFAIYETYAERCARMGMKYMNMHMQFVTTRNEGMERLFRATDRVLPVLKNAGIVLLYENVPPHGIRELGSETGDFDDLFSYYKNEPYVMLNIDTGHAHITDTMASLALKNPERWAYTHINDNFGVNDDHVAPGDGTMNFDIVASYAGKAGYTGPLMMEYHESGLEKGLETLREAYGKYGFDI